MKFWTFEKFNFFTIFQFFHIYEKNLKKIFFDNFQKTTEIVTLTHKQCHKDVFITMHTFLTHFRHIIRIRKRVPWFVKSILVRFCSTDLAEIAHMNYIWSILTVYNEILNFWKNRFFYDFSIFQIWKKNLTNKFLSNLSKNN